MSSRPAEYICVKSGAPLHEKGATLLGAGAASYPVVMGVPVLTHRPAALVASCRSALQGASSRLQQLEDDFREPEPDRGPHHHARRMRYVEAARGNLRLHAPQLEAVEATTDPGRGSALGALLDWLSVQNGGWPLEQMLPYFHQDWGGTEELDQVQSLICGALERHCPYLPRLVVLGAGACGLAHAAAERSRVVHAVDLSLPTLLLARTLLGGRALTVHVRDAHWRPTRLVPPPGAHNLLYAVANANALPFADGSVSAVVTQYLMDLVGDPCWTASEIRRVLAPGGVWVNFSNPFRMPGEPMELGTPELEEAIEWLLVRDWAVLEAKTLSFCLNNVSSLYEHANQRIQEVHFFMARKAEASGGPAARQWSRWTTDPGWRSRHMCLVPNREFCLLRSEAARNGRVERELLRIDRTILPVPQECAPLTRILLGSLENQHTVQQFVGIANAAGHALDDDDVRELFFQLELNNGLVRLRA